MHSPLRKSCCNPCEFITFCNLVCSDPAIRILGAVSLWSIEIIMQLRVYILFNQSKRVLFLFVKCPLKSPDVCLKVAFVNGVLFIMSIGIFLFILIDNTLHVTENTPDGACPTFKGGGRWALWLPGAYQPFITCNFSNISHFFSNALRIFSIRVGAVQNHSLLFCQNQSKRAAVARRHFVA